MILAKAKVDFSRSDEPKLLVEEAVLITEDDAKHGDGQVNGSSTGFSAGRRHQSKAKIIYPAGR